MSLEDQMQENAEEKTETSEEVTTEE